MDFFIPKVTYFIIRNCDVNWNILEAEIQFHNLMFIESGSCDIYIDHVKYHIAAGDVIYNPYGCIRSADNAESETRIYAFDFQLEGIDKLPLNAVTHFDDFKIFKYELSRFNYAWYQRSEGFELNCMALFSLILYKLSYDSFGITENPHVKHIKRYIIDHSSETLSVELLAAYADLNPVYLGALFKRVEGCSVNEYINRIRINKAETILRSDTLTITETAYETGFNDVFYFSKTFKKLVGLSPSQYRKQFFNI